MKTVHLMGIAGSGMASLAGMFVEKGWKVRGSDTNIYPPASTELERLKVEIRDGFKPENLEPRPDLVVVGNVIPRKNPEAQALLQSGIPYLSMPGAMTEHFLTGRQSVVVTGTHGKTTTTTLLAWILEKAGMAPGFFVGGVPLNFGRGYRIGSGKPFVLEGDEYDTAFFEKTPKFLHYRPHDVILTSIEFDHADIYRDLAHVVEQFEKLMGILPAEGKLLAWGESETVRKVVSRRKGGKTLFYGEAESCDWRAMSVKVTSKGTSFDVSRSGKPFLSLESPLLGRHNVLNVVAAVGLASELGAAPEAIREGVNTFKGVRRRQEFVGEAGGIRIYDDFAHHPTAISETLAAFRPMVTASKGRMWAIFEPRSNTVRRRVFQKVLPESFREADEVLLAPVYKKPDALAESELLSPEEVAGSIVKQGGKARVASSYDDIVDILKREASRGDLLLFMSNGSFGGIPAQTLEAIQRPRS